MQCESISLLVDDRQEHRDSALTLVGQDLTIGSMHAEALNQLQRNFQILSRNAHLFESLHNSEDLHDH
jgi:hypothetical protein